MNSIFHFQFAEFICYDDGCHLRKYATNPKRINQTSTATRMASIEIVVDKLHFKGHVDAWCHQHCDPYKFPELEKVWKGMKLYILYS